MTAQNWMLVGSVALILGCGSSREDGQLIDSYIGQLSALAFDEPSRDLGQPAAPETDGDYRCVRTPVTETRAYQEIVAYAANSESMWTGALVRGDSIYDGLFTQIVLDRAPMKISVSLENLDGARSATIETPSLSAFREALSGILSANVDGATAANIYSEIEIVQSESQVALALGASARWPGVPAMIAANFNFDESSTRSRYIVRFTQAYYTVDMDQPGKPTDAQGNGWPSSGIGGEGIVRVKPSPGNTLRLRARLTDEDSVSPNDLICDDQSVDAAFETGWRRKVSLLCTGDDAELRVTFDLLPI